MMGSDGIVMIQMGGSDVRVVVMAVCALRGVSDASIKPLSAFGILGTVHGIRACKRLEVDASI